MSVNLDALLDLAGAHARRILVEMKSGELTPMFLMIADHETMFMPALWRDEDEKAMILAVLPAFMREQGVTHYSLVSEAWTAVQPKGWKPGMPPGPAPAD